MQRDLEVDVLKVNSTVTNNAKEIVELREANEARKSELTEELTDHREDVFMADLVTSLEESISDINETVASNSDQIGSLKEYAVRNDENLAVLITNEEEIIDMNQEKISEVQESVDLLSKESNITEEVFRVENEVDNLDDSIKSLVSLDKANVKGNSDNITGVAEDVSQISNQKQDILIASENNMKRLNDISKQATTETPPDCDPLPCTSEGYLDCQDEGHCSKPGTVEGQTQNCSDDTHFICKSSGYCIPLNWKCDGDRDCNDGSDEKDCDQSNCHDWEFQCANGDCVKGNWVCDGEADCPDGSDEHENCPKKQPVMTTVPSPNFTRGDCNEWMVKCESGQCIPYWWKCDGVSDCDDGSDERNCGPGRQGHDNDNE